MFTQQHSQEETIDAYRQWCTNTCGLSKQTQKARVWLARRFLTFLAARSRPLSEVAAADIDAFFTENACHWKRLTVRAVSGWLKAFLSYSAKAGWCAPSLEMVISAPRIYRQEGVPCHVPWETVLGMLRTSAKDRSCRGLRNHAILMLLALYGIRSSEVARIQLKDMDWRKETIFIARSKGGRTHTLPLSPPVGNAILRYIRKARHNESEERTLFLGVRKPHKAITPAAVYNAAREALVQAGVKAAHLGPHCFRHSFATHLVNSGRSLKEVSEILGHRSIESTAVYAKVNLATLRAVADMNWEIVL